MIINDGIWIIEESAITYYFGKKIENIFTSSHPHITQELDTLFPETNGDKENKELTIIPSDEQIKEAIWSLRPLKSPGLDGFSGIFFRSYWEIVKEKVSNFVKECFRLGMIPAAMNKTFTVLIPKSDRANNFNHFHAISLCNFVYKVVAKIIASRLSKAIIGCVLCGAELESSLHLSKIVIVFELLPLEALRDAIKTFDHLLLLKTGLCAGWIS